MRTTRSANIVPKAPNGQARSRQMCDAMRILIRMKRNGASDLALRSMSTKIKCGPAAYKSIKL